MYPKCNENEDDDNDDDYYMYDDDIDDNTDNNDDVRHTWIKIQHNKYRLVKVPSGI